MASPSVTWTFTNGTTSDGTQVNTNFTDIINSMTDGTKDFHVAALNVEGAATFDGSVTLGDSAADDLTFTGAIAASIPLKANATYNIGASTTGLLGLYLGNGSFTTRLLAGTNSASYTFTFPPASPGQTGKTIIFDGNGLAEFRYSEKFSAAKTTTYTATGDETVIPCSGSAFTVTLPAAANMTGKELTIVKTDSSLTNIITIDGNASETINGSLTTTLNTQYESVTIVCDGSNWFIRQRYIPSFETAITSLTTDNLGTTTNVTGAWWRQGRYFFARIQFSCGTTVAASPPALYLPSGITIDTTNLGNAQHSWLGEAYRSSGSALNNPGSSIGPWPLTIISGQTGKVGIGTDITGSTTTNFFAFENATTNFNTGDKAEAHFINVPISGWAG
jgi:hypothetical protein